MSRGGREEAEHMAGLWEPYLDVRFIPESGHFKGKCKESAFDPKRT